MNVQKVITVFNKRLGEDRRDLFWPTCISSASFLESRSSGHSTDGAHSESLTYKLRIPIDATVQDERTYVSEQAYKALPAADLGAHWTLQKGDIILATETELTEAMTAEEVKQLAQDTLADVITVKEYADNTIRGSRSVQHWRIGGE